MIDTWERQMMGHSDVKLGEPIAMGGLGSTTGPFDGRFDTPPSWLDPTTYLPGTYYPQEWKADESMSWFPQLPIPLYGFKFVPRDCDHCKCQEGELPQHDRCCQCGIESLRQRAWDHRGFLDD